MTTDGNVTLSSEKWSWKFFDKVAGLDSKKIENCFSCGACVGDCPAARNSSFNFRKIIYDVSLGEEEKVLSSKEVWYCFQCFFCMNKCPWRIGIPYIISRLRRMALERGYGRDLLEILSSVGRNLMESGLSISPRDYARLDPKKAERELAEMRLEMGLPEKYEVSSRAMEELKVILKETGLSEELKKLSDSVKQSKECSEKY
ncbi:MAG: 4Fe-4S dicluster domain-containing protein [Candidatus Freyarchaeota archaeon]|nr:4Fe-4S dicluster domain-containing protein [Candidatus Jordarchaeia archaeon]MBS7267768.1 4Fe-4S dicluster domain-containing protein [Candidatus Jordarchaeia archaeon]MBS7279123.1 4Fe-4S dicluster domain-containing protein [Candidatus Jordarchaeia archaeon]